MKLKIFFASDKTINVYIPKEKGEKVIESLKNNWDGTYIFNENSGINFSFVTHYIIEEDRQEVSDETD